MAILDILIAFVCVAGLAASSVWGMMLLARGEIANAIIAAIVAAICLFMALNAALSARDAYDRTIAKIERPNG